MDAGVWDWGSAPPGALVTPPPSPTRAVKRTRVRRGLAGVLAREACARVCLFRLLPNGAKLHIDVSGGVGHCALPGGIYLHLYWLC